jgi:hypothetical protein
MTSFHSLARNGLPSLLPRHIRWIDVVTIWARPPYAVSGPLHGLDDEEAEAPSMSHIIPGTGSKLSLWFSAMVQIVRCRTAHLALSTICKLGQKLCVPHR